MTVKSNPQIKPEIYLVKEVIKNDLPDDVTQVDAYYLVDVTCRTYCASLTPSAWMEFSHVDIHTDNDSLREELEVSFGTMDMSYYNDWYVVKKQVEEKKNCEWAGPKPEEWDEKMQDHEGNMDAAFKELFEEYGEYYRANCVTI
jgi:hypothetical protein